MNARSLPLDQSVLFLDAHWIARHTYVWRKVHAPGRIGIAPALVPDQPWEGTCVIARSAGYDAPRKKFRLWYQTWARHLPSPESTYLCYAESADGFHWVKPNVGKVPWRGSRDNNIVVGNLGGLSPSSGGFDSPNVVEDPTDPDPARRFKLILYGWPTGRGGYLVGWSPDGVDWHLRPQPVLTKQQVWDTNTLLVDPSLPRRYVGFNRHARMYEIEHRRCIYRSDSADFEDWSEPALCLAPDLADDPGLQYYAMAVFRCSDLYLGLLQVLARSRDEPKKDRLGVRLAVSRDSFRWQIVEPRTPFFEPGPPGSFDAQWVYLNPPVSRPGDSSLRFFYDGRRHSHREAFPSGAVGVAHLRQEGFCSIAGGPELEGLLETVPFLLPAGDLTVNAHTHHGGALRVEMLSAEGAADAAAIGQSKPLAGLLSDGPVFSPLEWITPAPRAWAGRPVKLRFWLRNAEVFSFRFTA